MTTGSDLAFPKLDWSIMNDRAGVMRSKSQYLSAGGLSKREVFAVMAMQAMAPKQGHIDAATNACKYADALIAELAKGGP